MQVDNQDYTTEITFWKKRKKKGKQTFKKLFYFKVKCSVNVNIFNCNINVSKYPLH